MAILKVEGVTHWSIPVNDLEEAEDFYGELLGLTPVGRLEIWPETPILPKPLFSWRRLPM